MGDNLQKPDEHSKALKSDVVAEQSVRYRVEIASPGSFGPGVLQIERG